MDRKRIVELMHEATTEPYRFDEQWVVRFMKRLHKEDPVLAEAVRGGIAKKLEEINNGKAV